MALAAVIVGPVSGLLPGLWKIITVQDLLITDYCYVAGPGPALLNASLVLAAAMVAVRLSGEQMNGFTIVQMGLMAGFSLFGKNIANIWPMLLGGWLYARYRKEPFAKYVSAALLSTALSPLVSYLAFGSVRANVLLGLAAGVAVGFLLPPLSAYTYRIQNGMNLYNMGFACGLCAMMIVPVMIATGDHPVTALYWAKQYNGTFAALLTILCLGLILIGFFGSGRPAWAVWAGYRRLLSTTGRAPSDYLRMFGAGAVAVNAGVNGLVAMGYILLIGGQLNGPTVGAVLTVMGFSAYGKHLRNILPIMAGVWLGATVLSRSVNAPSLQIAALFGTTLAPVAGHFGWPYGVLAGLIHSALVLQTGGPVAGLNLYNNGFSGGLIATVLYPTITAVARHKRPHLQDSDYFDQFDEDKPIDTSKWRTHKRDREKN
ncbi:MAG: DUF1576 domain-containing protein [Ruminococcaceae bacterium]|nr:DUF1576 domain-containing protein [Oscillospiraceae bacterium]